MPRKRSTILEQQMRLTRLAKSKRLRALKPPFLCPWCLQETIFAKIRKPFIFIYCSRCKKGEVMPLHPTFKVVDFYCFFVDYIVKNKVPIFVFPRLTSRELNYIRSKITLGEVVCQEVL